MTPGARLAAAIEVFAAIEQERRPAGDALKAWGLTHRLCGFSDRAAIAGLLYDALRRRASSAFVMGEETPRGIVLGMLRRERGLDSEAIARLADGSKYAPQALSSNERARLEAADISNAPAHVAGDYPEWLDPYLARVFGEARIEEGAALASRAPLDLRTNTLKANAMPRSKCLPTFTPNRRDGRPGVCGFVYRPTRKIRLIHAEPAFLKGLVEIQDEGSQLAALLVRRAGRASR